MACSSFLKSSGYLPHTTSSLKRGDGFSVPTIPSREAISCRKASSAGRPLQLREAALRASSRSTRVCCRRIHQRGYCRCGGSQGRRRTRRVSRVWEGREIGRLQRGGENPRRNQSSSRIWMVANQSLQAVSSFHRDLRALSKNRAEFGRGCIWEKGKRG